LNQLLVSQNWLIKIIKNKMEKNTLTFHLKIKKLPGYQLTISSFLKSNVFNNLYFGISNVKGKVLVNNYKAVTTPVLTMVNFPSASILPHHC